MHFYKRQPAFAVCMEFQVKAMINQSLMTPFPLALNFNCDFSSSPLIKLSQLIRVDVKNSLFHLNSARSL